MLSPNKTLLWIIAPLLLLSGCGGGGGGSGGDNNAPTAVFEAFSPGGSSQAPVTVTFDASLSSDSDGSITSYQWSFGDNTFGSGVTTQHTYTSAGTYTIQLTVTDNEQASAIASQQLTLTGSNSGNLQLSGTLSAPEYNAIDGDTNDPSSIETANDSLASAQPLPNPVALGGFVSELGTGGGVNGDDRFATTSDESDFYQIQLVSGQPVLLEIADWSSSSVDLDLYLYDSSGSEVSSSVGVSDTEVVTAPADGDYYVEIYAYGGSSNYLLTSDQSSALASRVAQLHSLNTDLPIIPGELLVEFKDSQIMSASGLQLQADSFGLSVAQPRAGQPMKMAFSASHSIGRKLSAKASATLVAKHNTLMMLKKLKASDKVLVASPNYRFTPQFVPNDPYYDEQWHYPAINLPQAWELSTGSGAIVAVIDTGVYLAHDDLAANLVSGYDFISDIDNALDGNGLDNNPDDPGDGGLDGSSSWHGTHVAGTIAAVSNNNLGVAGVAFGAKVMPLRALGALGGSSYDIQQALLYAARLSNDSGTLPPIRADIANLSLGCSGCYSDADQLVYTRARNAGLIIIAAAGNESSSALSYPASYSGVVSVSAVNRLDRLANYSNYGSAVDVAAPGGEQSAIWSNGILSTLVDQSSGSRRASYEFYQGTSMAAPHVAGVAALMVGVYPGLTPDDFDGALSSFAIVDDLGTSGRDNQFGYGRINALKAVQYAQQLAGGTVESRLLVNPGSVDFGSSQNSTTIAVTMSGSDPIAVVAANSSASWLIASPLSIDGDGLGSYQLLVDRSLLSDGPYQATLTFVADNGAEALVQVNMRVGSSVASSGVGHLWLLLLDSDLNLVEQVDMDPDSNGQYPFTFTNLASGDYYLLAGTDSDNDYDICDGGEACGAYPTLGLQTPLSLTSNKNDADFIVLFGSGFASSTTASGHETKAQGLPRH